MANPYAQPTTQVEGDLPARRIAHSLAASVSSLLVTFSLVAWLLVAIDARLEYIQRDVWPVLRLIAFASLASLLSGFILLPYKRLKWYWAVLLGPVIALCLVLGAAFGYEHIMDSMYDPEV